MVFLTVTFWILVAVWAFIGIVHYCIHEERHDYHISRRTQRVVWALIHGPLTWIAIVFLFLVGATAHFLSTVESSNLFISFKRWLNKD